MVKCLFRMQGGLKFLVSEENIALCRRFSFKTLRFLFERWRECCLQTEILFYQSDKTIDALERGRSAVSCFIAKRLPFRVF